MAIGSLAASAAAAGTQYAAQSQAARAQAHYQNSQYAQTTKIASQNYQQQLTATGIQDQQNIAATSQQALANATQAAQLSSSGNVAAGEQGVAGNSVAELFNDYNRVQSLNSFNLGTNLSWQRQQMQQDQLSLYSQAKSHIASATPGPVQMPSALASALQIGSSALSTGDQLSRMYNTNDPRFGKS